jgi:hypothetical protein
MRRHLEAVDEEELGALMVAPARSTTMPADVADS